MPGMPSKVVTHRTTGERDPYGYFIAACCPDEDYEEPFENRLDPSEVDEENPTCLACIATRPPPLPPLR